jgi:DNA invertase Pin-like site-specific DNA recombinase
MSTRTPTYSAPSATSVAYSYIRFSTPEQARGDSLRRQTGGVAEAWCQRNGAALDTGTTLHDLGVSAFTKHRRRGEDDPMAAFIEPADLVNPDRKALAGFLALIKQRKVARGSYLIIENLDRLSRDDLVPAVHLLTGILLAGVRVVQLMPVEQVLTEKSEGYQIMLAVVELMRGHSESAAKSDRNGKTWDEKQRLARAGQKQPPRRNDGRITESMTNKLPAWIEDRGGKLVLIPERAEVVKRMFALAASGYGWGAIVRTLVRDKETPFCQRGKGTDGRIHSGEGYGRWNRVYVGRILCDRRALGEHQPRTRGGEPDGPLLVGYYPRVVTPQEFKLAQAGMDARRKHKQGRIGNGVACVLGGLLHDALDPRGGTYTTTTLVTRHKKDRSRITRRRVLVNSAFTMHREAHRSFPLATFERAILQELRELKPEEVLPRGEASADEAVLRSELEWVGNQKAALAAELLKGKVSEIAAALRQMTDRQAELQKALDECEEQTAKPLTASLAEAQSLTDMLDSATDPEDVRLRLRAALRRVVEGVWLVVTHRGRDALLTAQVRFRSGKHGQEYRTFTVIHRPPKSDGHGGTMPGSYWVISFPQPEALRKLLPFGTEDLRDLNQAEQVEHALKAIYDKETIDWLLRENGQPLP